MTYEPYEIVVVPFPFTESNQSKKRPAVVLSNISHQKMTKHITLLMITSVKKSSWPNDYLIQALPATGLTTPSIIRQKIFTIDNRLILKSIGKLSLTDKKAVCKQLEDHLMLD